jgi:hypothetical protein
MLPVGSFMLADTITQTVLTHCGIADILPPSGG